MNGGTTRVECQHERRQLKVTRLPAGLCGSESLELAASDLELAEDIGTLLRSGSKSGS
jgi:hypothetical protein